MSRTKLLTLCLITVLTVGTFMAVIPVQKAEAVTLADIDEAIDLALDWLDRMAYIEINSTHAVATDAPSLSFRIKHPDGNWTIYGKRTNYLSLPDAPDKAHVKGGAYCEMTECLNLGGFYNESGEGGGEPLDIRALLYKWDCDADCKYGDIVLYVEYATVNTTWAGLYGEIQYVEPGQGLEACDLYLGLDLVIDNTEVGDSFKLYKEWGWQGRRYTIRPTTKGLADLYYQLATMKFAHLGGQTYAQVRGVDYLDRAKKLYRTWYGSGYIIDRFDGLYNATLLERPFPEIHGGIPPNPDLIHEYKLAVPYDPTPYYINEPSWQHDWYSYTDTKPPSGPGSGTVLRHTVCSRHVMPENEEWVNLPFQCNDTAFIFPYKSRTGFEWARNTYIADGMAFDLSMYCGYIATPGPIVTQAQGGVVLGMGSDVRCIRACHDMWKYGQDVPYGLQTLRQEFIDSVPWDGNGVPCENWEGLKLFDYVAYGTHVTASYATALCLYYKLTGTEWYANRLDEVIGVLMRIQNKPGQWIYSKSFKQKYYRVEYVGAFIPGYTVTHSYGQANIYNYPQIDWIYWLLAQTNTFQEDFQPIAIPCLGNVECTIPSVWALILYRTLNRLPDMPEEPQYVLSFENIEMWTDHGGSNGGDGSVEIVGNVNSSYVGGETGNLYKHVGQGDKIRMTAWSGLGEGWSRITYVWNFTLDEDVENFRISFGASIPDWCGDYIFGGNSFTVQVEIYDSSWQLITSDKRIRENFFGSTEPEGGTGGICLFYDNLTMLESLSAGTYHVYLKLICHAGGDGHLALGYAIVSEEFPLAMPALPVQIDFFGISYGEAAEQEPAYNIRLDVNNETGCFEIGHCNSSNCYTYFPPFPKYIQTEPGATEYYKAVAEPGWYFWYWILNNTRLNITRKYYSDGIYVTTDYDFNLTAYFGTTPYSPGDTRLVTFEFRNLFYLMVEHGAWPSEADGPFVVPYWNEEEFHIYYRIQGESEWTELNRINMDGWREGEGCIWVVELPYKAIIEVKAELAEGVDFYHWRNPAIHEDWWNGTGPIQFSFNVTEDMLWQCVYVPPTTVIFAYDAETHEYLSGVTFAQTSPTGHTFAFSKCAYCIGDSVEREAFLYKSGYYQYDFTFKPYTEDYLNWEWKYIYLQPVGFGSPPGGSGGGGGFCRLMSRKITFYAVIPANLSSSLCYVDPENLMYVEPVPGKTGKIKVTMHYATMYPVIEFECQNIGFIRVDVKEFYRVYAREDVQQKIETSEFFGFRVDADKPLILELGGFERQPRELWKQVLKTNATGPSEYVKFESWEWVDGKIIATFTPGDPAVTVLWGSSMQTFQDMMLQLAFVLIAVAAVVTVLKIARKYVE